MKNIPILLANVILRKNIAEISSVSQWAELMGYSDPKKFSADYLNNFRKRPKKNIVLLKVQVAIYLLEKHQSKSCYIIAKELGLKDEKALNDFIRNHTGNPPTYYRKNGRI